MSEPADSFAKKRIVYDVAIDRVRVRRDLQFAVAGAESLTMDVYEPVDRAGGAAAVIVAGYPDRGFQSFVGCRYKDTGWAVSWAELLASSGITAVTYTNSDPLDVHKLLQHLSTNARGLGIDGDRIGLLASSGNGPLALSLLSRNATVAVRSAALCYAYTVDVGTSTAVADAAKTFRFACPATIIDDLRDDVPLFIARAGGDETPRLNEALDAFVAAALQRNLPIELVDLVGAPHAFDLFANSEETRNAIRRIVEFLRHSLSGA